MTAKKDIAVAETVANPFLEMVERVSTNPDIDADKLQKILDMQLQVLDREARNAFFVALNTVQANLPQVARDAANDQTRSMYAKLETISRAVTPVLTDAGFSTAFSQGHAEKDGWMRIEGVLRHRDGHAETSFVELPPDDSGIKGNVNKTQLHAAGSTFTYGRRYLKCMMLDIAVGDDTDGNMPADPLTDEQEAAVQGLLDELSTEDQGLFWKKARAEALDDLLAHRYRTYIDWLEKKRAEA